MALTSDVRRGDRAREEPGCPVHLPQQSPSAAPWRNCGRRLATEHRGQGRITAIRAQIARPRLTSSTSPQKSS